MNPLPKLIKKSDLSMDRLTFSWNFQEQDFSVNHLQLESPGDVEQCLVQIFNTGSQPAVAVCLGTGEKGRQSAAR